MDKKISMFLLKLAHKPINFDLEIWLNDIRLLESKKF